MPDPTPPAPPPATPPAAPPAPPPPPPPAELTPSLLGDTPPAAPPTPPAAPPAAADQAQLDAFIKDMPADTLDADSLKAVAPAFLKHGIKADQAKEIIGSYAAHVKAQAEAAAKQETDALAAITDATKKELGADLPTFVTDAKKGGETLFGKDLWGIIRSIPMLANDARMIKALAAYGRSVKTDDGAGNHGGGHTDNTDRGERWIQSSTPKA